RSETNGWRVRLEAPPADLLQTFENLPGYTEEGDITPLVYFALAGKGIVENGIDLALANAADRFLDVRHIFDLPDVEAQPEIHQGPMRVNFGEFQLFQNVNERRAALYSPVLIDLN